MLNKLLILGVFVVLATTLYVFKVVFDELKVLDEMKHDVDQALNNRNHISLSEQQAIEKNINNNLKLIKELASEIDMKVVTYWYENKHEIVALTEAEKTAKKLRQQADELERETNE